MGPSLRAVLQKGLDARNFLDEGVGGLTSELMLSQEILISIQEDVLVILHGILRQVLAQSVLPGCHKTLDSERAGNDGAVGR